MKFDKDVAIGFIIGYFILGNAFWTLMSGNLYYLFNATMGIGLALFVGLLGGKLRK